jgi:hypothetical protein
MNYQDRLLYAMQYFHPSEKAVKQGLRMTTRHKYLKSLLSKDLTDILKNPGFDGLIG